DSVDEAVVVFHLGNAQEREPTDAALPANPAHGDAAARAARTEARRQYIDIAASADTRYRPLNEAQMDPGMGDEPLAARPREPTTGRERN
ncbi:MAG: hypothetical protein LBS30_05595, partial [Planctomycetota bacterium]|nr:hypothetical protein [Planctomycetota bacterium]